jgi:hypothetical protein
LSVNYSKGYGHATSDVSKTQRRKFDKNIGINLHFFNERCCIMNNSKKEIQCNMQIANAIFFPFLAINKIYQTLFNQPSKKLRKKLDKPHLKHAKQNKKTSKDTYNYFSFE